MLVQEILLALLFVVLPAAADAACRLPPRMVDNYYGRVVYGQSLDVYRQPHGTRTVGRLGEGAEFLVVDGPRCVDGVYWWQITDNTPTTADDFRGWVMEGAHSLYFIEPLFGLTDSRPFDLNRLSHLIFIWRDHAGNLVTTDNIFNRYDDAASMTGNGYSWVDTQAQFERFPIPQWPGRIVDTAEKYPKVIWLFEHPNGAEGHTYDLVLSGFTNGDGAQEPLLLAKLTEDSPDVKLALEGWDDGGFSVFVRRVPVEANDAYFPREGGAFLRIWIDGTVEDLSGGIPPEFDQAVSPDGLWHASADHGGQFRLRVTRGDHTCLIPNHGMRVGYLRVSPESEWLYWSERGLMGDYTGFGVMRLGNCTYWRTAATPTLLIPAQWLTRTLLTLHDADGQWFVLDAETGKRAAMPVPEWAAGLVGLAAWGEG